MLREKDRSEIYKVAVNAALGSFLFGYQLVNISSLQILFQNVNNLTKQQTRFQLSIITASLPLMAILGSGMLKILMRKHKGRYLMIYMDLLGIVGMVIQNINLSLWPIMIGRLILGFVVGINSGLVAQYTFSVTPTALSGSVGALRQVFLNVGIATGYALGFLISPNNVEDHINWRILISFPIITCVIRSILLLTVLPYQIPLSRTRSKKIERMEKYYYKIYENYALGNQNQNNSNRNGEILATLPAEEPSQEQSLIKNNDNERRNLIICIILACSNQFCGINAIVFYAKQLFMRITDNNNNLSQISIILFGVVQILATFIGGKLMDKHSKKKFLFGGEIAMIVILAFIFFFNSNTPIVVTLIFMHSIAYSFSIGQLLLFYAAKMLDNTGYVVMVNWFATFLVALSAEFMMKWLGIGKMCLVFCVILSICLLILGKNLPSDQQLLDKQMSLLMKNPLQSPKIQGNVMNNEIIKEEDTSKIAQERVTSSGLSGSHKSIKQVKDEIQQKEVEMADLRNHNNSSPQKVRVFIDSGDV